MMLLIDNYDSFTYNLYQYLCELGADVEVRRNDALTVDEVERMAPEAIVISPGPGRPEDGGISIATIQRLGERTPLLGVCLGHQCIAAAFGGDVVRAPELRHGKTSMIRHDGSGIFEGLENPFEAVRYHSLIADTVTLPSALEVTARTDDGLIMGVKHTAFPIYGVQFHPESVLTHAGKQLLENFLNIAAVKRSREGVPA
jgi:anthranilate synthase/aminodeoxychorismate synthase-like glutamine amidotransferase